MHLARSLIVVAVALFVFAFAPSARADAFYVTFTNAAGASTPRMLGAAISITAPAGTPATGKGSIEIDGWLGSATMLTSNTKLSATVEYTSAPNGGVSTIAKFSDVSVQTWTGTFDKGSVTEKVDFYFRAQNISAGPAQPGAHVSSALNIARVGATTVGLAPSHIDDAYFSAPGIPAEIGSGAHAGQTKLTSFKLIILWTSATNNGPLVASIGYATLGKSTGAATQAFSNAEGNHTQLSMATITFVQKGIVDTTRFTMQFPNVGVASNAVNGQTEKVLLGPAKKLKLSDATTSATLEITGTGER